MTSDTPYRSLKGPFLNFLIRNALSNKVDINVLDVNIFSFLVERYNNLNYFTFTDYIGNIYPINLEIVESFAAFGVENINHAYPPTDTELQELTKLIDLETVSKVLPLIEYLHKDMELTDDLKESLYSILDNYDLDLNNDKLTLNPLPNNLNYTDLLFYRYYSLTGSYNLDKELLKSISLVLGNYHIHIDSKEDVLADDKTVFYAKLRSKDIIKNRVLELEIHKDYNILDFYKVVDPLLHLSSDVITKALIYISKLELLIRG